MNTYQNCQNDGGQYIKYFLKNGQPVQCTNEIIENNNGIETKKKCGVYLTNYGDSRSTDRSKNGGLHCIGCHRLYNREKQRKNRELLKKVNSTQIQQQANIPQNFNGMMAPNYENQFIPNLNNINLNKLTISDDEEDVNEIELLKEEIGLLKNEIGLLKNENQTLKENFEYTLIKIDDDKLKFETQFKKEIMEAFKLQQDQIGEYKRELDDLKEKHENLQSNFETVVINSQNTYEQIKIKQEEYELNNDKFMVKIENRVKELFDEKCKFIMDTVSKYVMDKTR